MKMKNEKITLTLIPLNRFEVLISRVMNTVIPSSDKEKKDRKMILREEKLKKEKKEKLVKVRKIDIERSNG